MGKQRKHQQDWPEAKKLCRLNQNDIAMAKSLGFKPGALIRARPDPKQKWKLPVKYWIHELHAKRFGFVLGEKPLPEPLPPEKFEYDEEAARLYGEQVYWGEYWDRNKEEVSAAKNKPGKPAAAAPKKAVSDESWVVESIGDDDVPF